VTRSLRVLVVDDNIDTAQMMATLLGSHGHAVTIARDALAALAAFEEFRPDVALLDIGLPVIDGYELALRVRAGAARSCRLVAITGHANARDRERGRRAGFDVYLTKPVKLSSVLLALAGPP
jgi:CheY-like chemotaxis protein